MADASSEAGYTRAIFLLDIDHRREIGAPKKANDWGLRNTLYWPHDVTAKQSYPDHGGHCEEAPKPHMTEGAAASQMNVIISGRTQPKKITMMTRTTHSRSKTQPEMIPNDFSIF